ncbi:MAG: hypothetical protein LBV00_09455 [Propionibacteriaceae bacterium]|nr:hypothetical protein [Propionibacteriaceae bacterium]
MEVIVRIIIPPLRILLAVPCVSLIAALQPLGSTSWADTTRSAVDPCRGLSIEYRVHMAGIGWGPWVRNGEIAGATARRIGPDPGTVQRLRFNPLGRRRTNSSVWPGPCL